MSSDVTVTFTVVNTRSTSTTVQYNDARQLYGRVWDVKGRLVYRWGVDRAFAQVVTMRSLAPDESMTFAMIRSP